MASWPAEADTAVLSINGNMYSDWESVLVKHMFNEQPPYFFRFTCSEGLPIASNIWTLRIRPGDYCTITLGGILAFSGYVHTRQVFYDARRHHVEIQGASTLETSIAAVITKGQEFTNKTRKDISRSVLESIGTKLTIEGSGKLSDESLPRVSVTPSITTYEFLDHLWRDGATDPINGVDFTSNAKGDFVIRSGETSGEDVVEEGNNILEARCVVINHLLNGKAAHIGQRPGNDETHGPQVASVPYVKGTMQALGLSLPSVVINEGAAWTKGTLQGREHSESRWASDDQITVQVMVRGWMRPSGGLWERGQKVSVKSPMLILNGEQLTLISAAFSQDSSNGTRTQLDLRSRSVATPQM